MMYFQFGGTGVIRTPTGPSARLMEGMPKESIGKVYPAEPATMWLKPLSLPVHPTKSRAFCSKVSWFIIEFISLGNGLLPASTLPNEKTRAYNIGIMAFFMV